MDANRSIRRLQLENLEGRRLMACDAVAGLQSTSSLVGSTSRAAVAAASSPSTHLVGRLAPPNAGNGVGLASFETHTFAGVTKSEFEVHAAGLPAGATFSVTVDGVSIGTFTTNARGQGKLELKTGSARNPLPAGFAPVAGAVVNVINAEGATVLSTTLATPPKPVDKVLLATRLADPTGASKLKGEAGYTSATVNGLQVRRFIAEVRGGVANTTVDVTVDGVVVGQINLDGRGRGRLVFSSSPQGKAVAFPDNFPTPAAGSTISVGAATGTLAAPPRRR